MNSCKKFLRVNDILHTLTAPGHPTANRLAESYVGEFKDKLGKIADTSEYVQGHTYLIRKFTFQITYKQTA